jgi:hypothetical protein
MGDLTGGLIYFLQTAQGPLVSMKTFHPPEFENITCFCRWVAGSMFKRYLYVFVSVSKFHNGRSPIARIFSSTYYTLGNELRITKGGL